LAICKEIINDHQRKTWAENNPQGGSIVNFVVPYELKTPEISTCYRLIKPLSTEIFNE